jgi:hypothetical protein
MGRSAGYNHIENETAYNAAIDRRIKANAIKGREQRWFAEDATRADLAEQVRHLGYDKGGFWAKMALALDDWGSLTPGQEAACRRILTDDAAKKAERLAADANSRWVGEIKQRLDFTVTLQGTFDYETDFGTVFGHIMKDQDGNVILYKGSNRLDAKRGDTFTVKATVKKHDERNGVQQTIVNRPKMALSTKGDC